jgi:hypothetical protein
VAYPSTLPHRWAFAALALVSGACSGPAEIPSTPDLAELQASYNAPSATLDKDTAREALDTYPDLVTLAGGFQSMGLARAGASDASRKTDESSGSGVDLQGSLRVTVRCPGELGNPVYDERVNGSIGITIGLDRSRVLRGIAGQASNCLAHEEFAGLPFRVRLDGPFTLDLGGNLRMNQLGAADLLVSLQGAISINDIEFSSLTGRLSSTGGFETLWVLASGSTVVLNVGTDGSVGVRDSRGNWFCATDELDCSFE